MKTPVTVSISVLADRTQAPSAEELRMVRAIVQTAVQEAERHGEYQAAFHGFRIYAQRRPNALGHCVAIAVFYRSSAIATCALESFVVVQVL